MTLWLSWVNNSSVSTLRRSSSGSPLSELSQLESLIRIIGNADACCRGRSLARVPHRTSEHKICTAIRRRCWWTHVKTFKLHLVRSPCDVELNVLPVGRQLLHKNNNLQRKALRSRNCPLDRTWVTEAMYKHRVIFSWIDDSNTSKE